MTWFTMNRHRRSWHSKEMHSEETFIMDQQNQGRRGYIHCWGLLLLRSRAPEAGQCHVFVYFLSLGMSDSIYVCLLNKLCISMYSYSFLPHCHSHIPFPIRLPTGKRPQPWGDLIHSKYCFSHLVSLLHRF